MPFGVKNAPAAFQSLMKMVLANHNAHATAYMDDVIIFSSSWDEHIRHIDMVLTPQNSGEGVGL